MEWRFVVRLGSALSCVLLCSMLSAEPRLKRFYVESDYQPDTQRVRVLLPDRLDLSNVKPDKKIRILYVLPVEEGAATRWGDPVKEAIKADLANQHRMICVFPEFAQLPWYADHPTDKAIRQESYLLKSVIPYVDEELSLNEAQVERYLVGFSKSGWGAFTLLLRNPGLFKKAAAWDAPLMMQKPGPNGSDSIFGNSDNFDKYEIASLLRKRKKQLQGAPRLISMGYDNFRENHLEFHIMATELNIPHLHRDGPQRRHHWESGWLREAVDLLMSDKQK